MDRLAVSVSEGKLHEVEAPDAFETDGPFVVAVSNRGRDSHVHLRLDGNVADAATLSETNPHVPRDETVEIVADVDAVSAPVSGLLTVETGYGADGRQIDVTLDPPAAAQNRSVGAATRDGGPPGATATPAPTPSSDDGQSGDGGAADEESGVGVAETVSSGNGVDVATLAVGVLAVGAVGVAVGAAATVTDPIVVLGAAAVVLAVGLAAVLILR